MAAGFGSLRAKYIEGGVITSAMSIFTSCLGGGDNVLRAWRWPHAWIMCRIPPHYALCTILDCSIAKWSEGGLWGWDTFRKNHSGRNINLCHCLQLAIHRRVHLNKHLGLYINSNLTWDKQIAWFKFHQKGKFTVICAGKIWNILELYCWIYIHPRKRNKLEN